MLIRWTLHLKKKKAPAVEGEAAPEESEQPEKEIDLDHDKEQDDQAPEQQPVQAEQ